MCSSICLFVGVGTSVSTVSYYNRGSRVFCSCSQSSMESPNLEFEYGDTDALTAELSGETASSFNVKLSPQNYEWF